MLGWIILAVIYGRETILVFTAKDRILDTNLGQVVAGALRGPGSKVSRAMLSHAIQIRVKSRKINELRIDAIDLETGEVIGMKIRSPKGIDESVLPGNTCVIPA